MELKIKLALLQLKVEDDKEYNIEKACHMISKASSKKADILILPEMFNCPYENSKFLEYAEEQERSPTLNAMSQAAHDYGVHLIAGTIPERDKEKIYNTSFFFNDKGEILGFHRKMHLFDIDVPDKIYFRESDTLSAGREITVIDCDLGKFGMAICYDLRFPELSRLMTLRGADILVYPGAFNLITGPAHWKTLLRSRAIDNQVFVVAVSQARNYDASYVAYGHSLVCNPWGEVLVEAGPKEDIIYTTINLKDIEKFREELPLLNNRREDVYSIVIKNKLNDQGFK